MTRIRHSSIAPGRRLSDTLTVLGHIDAGAPDPVIIAWHHGAWCPMACKIFRKPAAAKREAAILAAFAHPYIVRPMGLENGTHLLMEFLEGQTVADYLRTHPGEPLAISDALRIAIHAGSALQHIHERGYVHLDVKPGNIIVTPAGRPVLFDFGIARRIGGSRPKGVAGTDLYIAPEECEKQDVGPPADVFGLGVAIYKMLTGKMPFGDGRRRKPFPQLGTEPTPVRAHRRALPDGLDRLILSCLARNSQARPALVDLLPKLHTFISVGPQMWPAGFRPEAPPARLPPRTWRSRTRAAA